MSTNTFVLDGFQISVILIIAIIAITIATIVIVVNRQQNEHYLDMSNKGYNQVTIPGYAGVVWQKGEQK